MRKEFLNPLEIIPVDPPYKPQTVESLCRVYESNDDEALDKIPFVFVHFVKNKGLYMVDGHHRTGVAHLNRKSVNALFLNTFRDLQEAYVLADLGLIPAFRFGFPIEERLPYFSQSLPAAHNEYAVPHEVETFDDFVDRIRGRRYVSTRPKLSLGMRL